MILESQKEAQKRYNDKFDILKIRLPKGTKERIQASGKSLNEYITIAIFNALNGDNTPVKQPIKEERAEQMETAIKADKTPEKQEKQPDKLPEAKPIQQVKTEEELSKEDEEYINTHNPWETPTRDLSVSRMLKERWKERNNSRIE